MEFGLNHDICCMAFFFSIKKKPTVFNGDFKKSAMYPSETNPFGFCQEAARENKNRLSGPTAYTNSNTFSIVLELYRHDQLKEDLGALAQEAGNEDERTSPILLLQLSWILTKKMGLIQLCPK